VIKKREILLAIGGLALGLGGSFASGQDWPQWRGANRDGKAAGFVAPKSWPKELVQKWKTPVGLGDASPSLQGDKLFVFARQGGSEVLLCLEAGTGKEVWQDKYDAAGVSGPASGHSGPRSSPAVGDGKVVTLGVQGTLSCLEAGTGKVLWRKDDFPGSRPQFFTASSPIVQDGRCIAQLGGRGSRAIVSYDLATGAQKWKWAGDGTAYASPVILVLGGTKFIVAQTEGKMVAIEAAEGKLVWEAPFPTGGRMSYNASTPVVDGQTVYYGGGGRGTKAVRFEKQGEAIAAKELWSNTEKSFQFNSPVLKEGRLYGLSQGQEFFCLEGEKGQIAWTGPKLPTPSRTNGYGSIVDAGSILLALTPASEIIAFEPSSKEYAEVARIKVAGTPTFAHLVVSGGRLFVKDQDSVTLWTLE
jgi:outer membrane protein assembly factor BamB